jgi:hypothetical protein
VPTPTDQKVGGSSPSERAQVSGRFRSWDQPFACRVQQRSTARLTATKQVEIKQEGELLQVATITRGLSEEEGGYYWSGELRLWDNEILMGWYAANDGPDPVQGHLLLRAAAARPEHVRPLGRARLRRADHERMGLDGTDPRRIEKTMTSLIESEGVAYVND